MNAAEFRRVRRSILARIPPSSGLNRTGVEQDVSYGVEASGRLSIVKLKNTGEAEYLIVAHCRPTTVEFTRTELTDELDQLWRQMLSYNNGFEAHLISVADGQIVLDGITTRPGDRFFITVRIVVDVPSHEPIGRQRHP